MFSAMVSACADPAAQPEVSVTVSGLTATTTARGVTPGDIGIELNFVPSGSMGGARPHRRTVLYEGGDVQSFRVQVPEGTYSMSARVTTFLNCNSTPRELQLGASAASISVVLPVNAGDGGAQPTIAVSPTTIPAAPCS